MVKSSIFMLSMSTLLLIDMAVVARSFGHNMVGTVSYAGASVKWPPPSPAGEFDEQHFVLHPGDRQLAIVVHTK